MHRSFLTLGLFAFALASPGVATPAAAADGLPIVGTDAGPDGIASSAGDVRYVTLAAGRNTMLARVDINGGRVVRSRFLRGRFTIPVVAYDASASGLSADGETLVLVRPRATFPQSRTRFAIFASRALLQRDAVTLPGDFSFDAISPDGSLLYFVQYVSPRDPTRYAVRAYDVRAGRLLRGTVVDKRQPGEKMRGNPITRANSPDGRWAYTLYDGAGRHPFIHALDTRQQRAACIDLDGLSGRNDLFDLRLSLSKSGEALSVISGKEPLALVDTKTFRVTAPASNAVTSAHQGGSGLLIALAAGGMAMVAAVSLALRRRRRLPAT
jgi:hypothetical protein